MTRKLALVFALLFALGAASLAEAAGTSAAPTPAASSGQKAPATEKGKRTHKARHKTARSKKAPATGTNPPPR